MSTSRLCKPAEHRLSRRQWLGAASAGLAGLSLSAHGGLNPLLADELKKRQKQVLLVWLDGGLSQYESWDPKPNTQFGGPFRSISTSVPGTHVCELMPNMSRQMHRVALVRSISTKDNAHSSGVMRIQRGDPKNRGVNYPVLGSAVARWIGAGDSGLPAYVHVKPGSGGFQHQEAGFLAASYGAIAFGDGLPPDNLLRPDTITAADEAARDALRLAANRRYAAEHRPEINQGNDYVFRMARELMRRRDLFDSSKIDPRDVERYGSHEIGRHMLIARKLLENGVTCVKVTSYGWDTHGDNFNAHASLVPKFDQALAAMLSDLADRGMLDNVLVIAMSEFGRSPKINGHIGRDHYPESWSIAMAGCGIKPGVVVGATDPAGVFVATEPYDIGHMFHTWFKALGIDPAQQHYDNGGQPLPLANEDCHAVAELLA